MTDNNPGDDEDGTPVPPFAPAGLADERFAANIREERERQGKSQAEIARLLSGRGWRCLPQTIQRIEAGHRKVSVGEGKALAEILGTTVDRLTWPGREASAAALLDSTTARADSAYEQITQWTGTLLYSQRQLDLTLADVERARFHGSAKIAALAADARKACVRTPEAAVEEGRAQHESLIDPDAEYAGPDEPVFPLLHEEETR